MAKRSKVRKSRKRESLYLKAKKEPPKYPEIDMEWTGRLLKNYINKSDYDIQYIQRYLHLSCPQPIYRWFNGKNLPTIDHLYALSKLFGVHMDDLIVEKQIRYWEIEFRNRKGIVDLFSIDSRFLHYAKHYMRLCETDI